MLKLLPIAIGLAAALPAQAQAQGMPSLAYQLSYSINAAPDPSPDGRRLVFVKTVESVAQIFVMDVNGRGERQLTRARHEHEDPAWSPDGTRIAYVLNTGTTRQIHVMNADGSGDRAVSPIEQHAIHPSWTPDGKRLLYCTDDDLRPPLKNDAALLALDLETGRIETIVAGGVNTYPVMSPDGTRIAYRHMIGEMNSEVFVADADGRNIRNLTSHPSFEGWPAWSPDGKTIAFAANRYGRYQIFLMDAGGGNVRLLANTEGRATAPKFSRDGTRVYFTNCVSVDYGATCEIMAAPVARQPL